MRKEKGGAPQKHTDRHSHPKADRDDFLNRLGILLSPKLGGQHYHSRADSHNSHLQKILDLVAQSHAGQSQLAVAAQHYVIRKAYAVHHQVLQRDDQSHGKIALVERLVLSRNDI